MFFCDLNKILDERYQVLKSLVKELTGRNGRDKEDQCSLRKKELQKYVIYRDKIFAHTAFGSPEYRDGSGKKFTESSSTRYTSLSFFSGSMAGIGEKGMVLGGMSIKIGEELSEYFPEITFVSVTGDAAQNISSWWKMFESVMDLVKTTSDELIIEKQPNIERIVRKT